MSSANFLRKAEKFEIQAYKKPKDLINIKKTHISYSGSPQKHQHDPGKIILVPDPYSSDAFYYEFKIEDISYVEELSSLVSMEGETVTMVRIWIKKMSVGIKSFPFIVEDTTAL
ncbi:MAG: inorganic pyrophosphatase Ppa [Deltaproteobacteria bacterium]|nr:inorganic pyrophosphatase Ppa [Deltaproteobacteria bacterium]